MTTEAKSTRNWFWSNYYRPSSRIRLCWYTSVPFLREEGYKVVLVNSNPATIMTDTDIADRVYVEPISLEFVTEVIKKERPWGLLATLGGQVGLNMAVQLSEAGVLEEYGVKLLGTTLEAIKHAEDREFSRKR